MFYVFLTLIICDSLSVIRSSSKALIAMSVGGCWFQIELLLINIIVFLSSVADIKSGGWLSCWHICKRPSETAHEYHRIKHRFRCWIFVCFMVEWSRIPLVACLVLYVANRQKFMHESNSDEMNSSSELGPNWYGCCWYLQKDKRVIHLLEEWNLSKAHQNNHIRCLLISNDNKEMWQST